MSPSLPGGPLPVQSRMRVPAAAEEALGELAARAASLQAASGGNLLECSAAVPDPRDARGIRHSLASMLALCTAAVLCGHTAVEDITAWIGAAPQQVLAAAGCRRNDLDACVPPHPDTVVRIFSALGAGTGQPCGGVPGPTRASRPGQPRDDPIINAREGPDGGHIGVDQRLAT
jgi:DDE_Tnp_1-associated